MTDEILKRIDVLAAKLNTTGEQLFAVLTRQAYIDGVTACVYVTLCGVITLYCIFWMRLAHRANDGESLGGALIIGLISLCVGCIYVPDIIIGFMNPQYGAVQTLAQLLRGGH